MLSEWRKGSTENSVVNSQTVEGDVEMQHRPPDRPRYLFVCVTQERNHRLTSMTPICMSVHDDDKLFRLLKEGFQTALGHWRRFMMVKRMVDIRFVQV